MLLVKASRAIQSVDAALFTARQDRIAGQCLLWMLALSRTLRINREKMEKGEEEDMSLTTCLSGAPHRRYNTAQVTALGEI